MEQKRVYLKLHFRKIVKRLHKIPMTFDELNQQIEKSFKDAAGQDFEIIYKDSDGDWIEVSDDDDLMAALEFADENLAII